MDADSMQVIFYRPSSVGLRHAVLKGGTWWSAWAQDYTEAEGEF